MVYLSRLMTVYDIFNKNAKQKMSSFMILHAFLFGFLFLSGKHFW